MNTLKEIIRKQSIKSKTLDKDIEVEIIEFNTETSAYGVISHESLKKIIIDNKIKYSYKCISSEYSHSVVECTMLSKDGYEITEVGETMSRSLVTPQSKNIPTYMAYKRAFDNAAIVVLGLEDKYVAASSLPEKVPSIEDDIVDFDDASKMAKQHIISELEVNEEKEESPITPENEVNKHISKEIPIQPNEEKQDNTNNAGTNDNKGNSPINTSPEVKEEKKTSNESNPTGITEDTIIDFGPFNGKTVKEVLDSKSDPEVASKLEKIFLLADKLANPEQKKLVLALKNIV